MQNLIVFLSQLPLISELSLGVETEEQINMLVQGVLIPKTSISKITMNQQSIFLLGVPSIQEMLSSRERVFGHRNFRLQVTQNFSRFHVQNLYNLMKDYPRLQLAGSSIDISIHKLDEIIDMITQAQSPEGVKKADESKADSNGTN